MDGKARCYMETATARGPKGGKWFAPPKPGEMSRFVVKVDGETVLEVEIENRPGGVFVHTLESRAHGAAWEDQEFPSANGAMVRRFIVRPTPAARKEV